MPHWLSHDLPQDLQDISDELAAEMDPEEARMFCVALLQDVGDLDGAEQVNEIFTETDDEEEEDGTEELP